MVATPNQTDTYTTALDIFDRTHPLRVDVDENLKVNVTASGPISGTVAVSNFPAVQSVNNLSQLVPVAYDYISLGYTGADITGVVYKTGGASGTTVATLALTYDGSSNILTVTRT